MFKQSCNIRNYKLTQSKTSKITALVLSDQLHDLSARCKNIIVDIFLQAPKMYPIFLSSVGWLGKNNNSKPYNTPNHSFEELRYLLSPNSTTQEAEAI